MAKNCESCLMPFAKDPGKRESEIYCSYCFNDGKLTYAGSDLKEFQRICFASMREHGMNRLLAYLYTYSIRFAPRWRRKR